MISRRIPSAPARRGFTLLELVIAVAIMAILAGTVVPVASLVFQTKARAATRDELEGLATACAEYFRDVGALPSTLGDLGIDRGAPGWSGPYLIADSVDESSGLPETVVDAWSRAYRLSATSSSTLTITSLGEDGVLGTGADLERALDVTPIRREKTLEQLRTINQAVTLYNGQYLPDTPLSTSYDQLLSTLVATGLLPSATSFATDGWGDAFVPDPLGLSPVVRIASIHLP